MSNSDLTANFAFLFKVQRDAIALKNKGTAAESSVATEQGNAVNHVTKLTLNGDATSQLTVPTGGGANYGIPLKLYTFPANCKVTINSACMRIFVEGSPLILGDTPEFGVGTQAASGYIAALVGDQENVVDALESVPLNDKAVVRHKITTLTSGHEPPLCLYLNTAGWFSDLGYVQACGDITIEWTCMEIPAE